MQSSLGEQRALGNTELIPIILRVTKMYWEWLSKHKRCCFLLKVKVDLKNPCSQPSLTTVVSSRYSTFITGKSSWPATGFELNERFFDIHMGRVNIQEFQEQKALLQHILEGEMRLLHIKSFLFTINRDVVLDSAWLHNTSKTRRVKNLFYRFLMVSRRRKRKKRTPPHRCKQHCEAPFGIGS